MCRGGESGSVWRLDSIMDKGGKGEAEREREGQFGLRISVKGKRREGDNK